MPLYVPLREETLERLKALAREERRRPQDQAAYLLEKALSERKPSRTQGSARDASRD